MTLNRDIKMSLNVTSPNRSSVGSSNSCVFWSITLPCLLHWQLMSKLLAFWLSTGKIRRQYQKISKQRNYSPNRLSVGSPDMYNQLRSKSYQDNQGRLTHIASKGFYLHFCSFFAPLLENLGPIVVIILILLIVIETGVTAAVGMPVLMPHYTGRKVIINQACDPVGIITHQTNN